MAKSSSIFIKSGETRDVKLIIAQKGPATIWWIDGDAPLGRLPEESVTENDTRPLLSGGDTLTLKVKKLNTEDKGSLMKAILKPAGWDLVSVAKIKIMQCIIGWDVVDNNGDPVSISDEILKTVDSEILNGMLMAIDRVNPSLS